MVAGKLLSRIIPGDWLDGTGGLSSGHYLGKFSNLDRTVDRVVWCALGTHGRFGWASSSRDLNARQWTLLGGCWAQLLW